MQKFRRTRYGLAVTSSALLALGLTTGMSPYKSVDVSVDGRVQETGTYASESVNEFLRDMGLHVDRYDLVEPARTTVLQSGMKIVVKLAKTVTLRDGGKPPIEVHTLATTVGDLLHSMGIRLRKQDTVSIPVRSEPRDGMRIVITRRDTVVYTSESPIAFETVQQASSAYAAGQKIVVRSGENGTSREIIRKYYVNGRLMHVRKSQSVVRQPVDELVDVGTAQPTPVLASRSGSSLVANDSFTVQATAYSNPGGFTATGAPAGYGDIAVDPSIIPLGTKLYIPGYGYGIANDTGGAIQGYRIDLCFDSVGQAIDWGRKDVTVYILGHVNS